MKHRGSMGIIEGLGFRVQKDGGLIIAGGNYWV